MAEILSGNVTVMVTNLDKSVEFYTDTLGLKLKNRFGEHWADIEGPGIAIGLHPTSKDINRGTNLQIGLRVADIDQAVSDLEKKGVEFKINDEDQVRLASFKDPDNNILYLVQTRE